MAGADDGFVVIATCATRPEADSGLELLHGADIRAELRPAGERTEIAVAAPDAPAARRVLLDDRLNSAGGVRQEMSFVMKLALVFAFLAVVTFAILTVTLG